MKAIFRISRCGLCLFFLVAVISFGAELRADAQIAPTTTATISGSVSDSAGKLVAGAKVSLSGPKSSTTQTDAQGLFVFVGVPFGAYSIAAAASGLGTATHTGISVQGDTNVAIQYEPMNANGLKVIAQVSSSTAAQFNVTPASITQVNPIADAFEGKTSWRTMLEQIPGVAQAGLQNGYNPYAALPDSPFMPVQISINGALPYETATLLDDMPLIGGSHTELGAGTDLGLYPLNGFDTADVIRGPGAAAPSIVDSIGGSFLLHAPGSVTNNHYDFSASTDAYGGIVSNALIAIRAGKFSATVTYGVNDSPGPLANAGIPAYTAFTPSSVGGESFGCTNLCGRGVPLVSPNYAAAACTFYGYHTELLTGGVNMSTAWSQQSGSLALNYALSPSVTAGIFYAGETSRMSSPYEDLTIDFSPPSGYSGAVPAGQQFLSVGGVYLVPIPTQQASSLIEEKITAQIGRGTLRLAALQNRTFFSYSVNSPTSANVRLFGGGALCSNTSLPCDTSNPTYAPTIFNGGVYNVDYLTYSYSQTTGNNNRDVLVNYITPLGENFHLGGSFVKSYYNAPSFYDCDYAGYLASGSTPSAISQTTNESRLFFGGNLSDRVSLDISLYFANANYHVQNPNDPASGYVDANYTYATPRVGFVWRPTASIAVRAAAGGGFAEAPLGDLVGCNFVYSPTGAYYQQFASNLRLQPEKSFAFDFGTDIRLHRNSVFSFDVYRSNLYGQVYNSTTLTGTYTGSLGTLPLYTTQYGNLGVSRYEGVLIDLRHSVPHGVYWSLSGGLTRGYVVSLPSDFYNIAGGTCNRATGANCTNVTVVPNVNFNGTFAASIPYSQALGTLGYRWNDEKFVDVIGTYYGNNNTYFRPAFVELDGNVGYPLSKKASLLLTFKNITGIYSSATEAFSLENLSGAPTITGLPYPLYGEEYGPRTVILTAQIHM